MSQVKTVFGSMENYVKGDVEILGDDSAGHYAFSNVFEIANTSVPYERVVAAINLEYVIEVIRAEGSSDWYICAHDETALVMDRDLEITLLKPADQSLVPAKDNEGAVKLGESVEGKKMGVIKLQRGHLALLPAGAAYRFKAVEPAVAMIQTLLGAESVQKWPEICLR